MYGDLGGFIYSPDSVLFLSVPASAFQNDTYLTIIKKSQQSFESYQIGPGSMSLNYPGLLSYRIPSENRKTDNYQLEQQSSDGSWEVVRSEVSGNYIRGKISKLGTFRLTKTENLIPANFALHQNYPNPFFLTGKTTRFTYELSAKTFVQVIIYNILGKQIKTFVKQVQDSGIYEVVWDGKDDTNRKIATGIYFYQLRLNKKVFTKKLLVLQ